MQYIYFFSSLAYTELNRWCFHNHSLREMLESALGNFLFVLLLIEESSLDVILTPSGVMLHFAKTKGVRCHYRNVLFTVCHYSVV